MQTFMPKEEDIERKWYVVDAAGKTLGRLSTEVARILRGKHKPTFTPHLDMGDYVIVVNADKVVLTGKKLEQKKLYRHSQYPGGLRTIGYDELMEKNPELVVKKSITGMLPHNRLGRQMARKLKVYAGPDHPHEAQQPEKLDI